MKFSMILSRFQPDELLGIIKAAERSGLYGLSMPDHVAHPVKIASTYPYYGDEVDVKKAGSPLQADIPQLDPWAVGAFLAAASPTLHFITAVYLPIFRHPLSTAKAAATVSGLLGKRFIFGVGMGWMREEYDCFGLRFAERGARFDEIVDILRLMWAGGEVEYHGRFYDFPAIGTNPTPPYPVPLYFGGHSDQMLIRAAKRGDGWICAPKLDIMESQMQRLRKLREEFGRADEPFEFIGMSYQAEPTVIEKMASLGIKHVLVMPPWQMALPTGPKVEGEKAELIERLGEELSRFN